MHGLDPTEEGSIFLFCGRKTDAWTQIEYEASERIKAIYHMDNKCNELSPEERLDNRQQSVKPLVDAYFAWVKEKLESSGIDRGSEIYKALNYSNNQEQYIRTFLEDPLIPLDNNDAERSIKKFCVGKHSWHIIESKNGAYASAMMYSIAETAKANMVNPQKYFKYLMEEIIKYLRNEVPQEEIEKLMPWSSELPDDCKIKAKK